MKEQIQKLERTARLLEPDTDLRNDWYRQMIAHADDFLDTLPEQKAFTEPPGKGSALRDLDIPERGRPLEDLLPLLSEHLDRNGINPASPRHFGYIPGGGVVPTAMGDYLAAVTNRYAGIFFANPGAVQIENKLLRWMCDQVGYPANSLGTLVSGGSIATLTAVAAARDAHRITGGRIPRTVVYLTSQTHHCLHKALRLTGLGEVQIRTISMDERFRMQPEALRRAIARDQVHGLIPFMIVGSGGTTNTGAVDPLDALADIAEEYRCWYHVDAAYGGFFILSDRHRPLFKGIERSDSIVIDPHKGLFLAYGIGALLVREVKPLFDSQRYSADYMRDADAATEELSPADLSPELTRHFRGLRMWLPLQLFGIAPFRAALEEKVLLCRYFHKKIKALGFITGPEPQLSITIFRYLPAAGDPNTFNEALIRLTREDGRFFFSTTTIDGSTWIRLAVLSFRTHLEEVDGALALLGQLVEQVPTVMPVQK